MSLKILDTHIHIWDLDKADYPWLAHDTSLLHQTYRIETLEEERTAAGITAGILVQASGNFEDTDLMLETAARKDWIKAVVGWLPLPDPAHTEQVWKEKYAQNPYFKGVRHQIHDEPDTKWLLQENVLESLQFLAAAQLPYDLVGILTAHIETALRVAEKIPALQMVFDHLNQPPVRTREQFGIWGNLMKEAAKHPVFSVKISGLGTIAGKADWTEEDILPYLDFVLEHFGVDRCFCGGDWPVCLLAGDYTTTWDKYRKALLRLVPVADAEKILYSNACRFYNLPL